jgi:regulator of RNase E activity RraA
MSNTDIIARLRRLDTSIVSDVLDEAGYPDHAIHRSVALLDGKQKLAGAAQCFRNGTLVKLPQAPASRPKPSRAEMENKAAAGVVVVLATGGYEGGAMFGGLLAKKLKEKSSAGILTDGLVRDANEIIDMEFPLAAAGLTPVNSGRRAELVEANAPVPMPLQGGGTITINPGDYILGDRDGIIVIPQQHVEAVIGMAEELINKETLIQRDMESGLSREEAFKRHPRFSHIKWLRP